MDSQVLQTQVGDPPDLNDKYFRSLSSAPQAILCVACEGSKYQYRVLPFECFIASWVLRSTGREQSHPRAEYLFFSEGLVSSNGECVCLVLCRSDKGSLSSLIFFTPSVKQCPCLVRTCHLHLLCYSKSGVEQVLIVAPYWPNQT